MSPRLRRALVALALVALAYARVLASPGTRVVGMPEGELRQHLWVAWMVGQSLAEGLSPVPTRLAGFPGGVSIVPLDPLWSALVALFAPLLDFLPAFNAVTALALGVLALGAQRLAGALGASPLGEIGAAVLGVTAPPLLGAWADTLTESMGAGWWLFLAAELLGREPPRPWRVVAYSAALLLSGPYLAHASAPVFAVLALRGWIPPSRGSARLPAWSLGLVGLLALAVAAGLFLGEGKGGGGSSGPGGILAAREGMAIGEFPPRSVMAGVEAPPPLPDLGVARHVVDYPIPEATGPRAWAPWGLLLMVLASLVNGARPPVTAGGGLPGRLVGGAAAGAYALLALGSTHGEAWGPFPAGTPTPFDLYYRYFPLAHLAWKPAQCAVPAYLLAIVAMSRLDSRLLLAGALAVAAEAQVRGPTPLPLPASELVPREAWLALHDAPAGAVVEFPCRDRWLAVDVPPLDDSLLGPLWHERALGDTLGRRRKHGAHDLLRALEASAREGAAGIGTPGEHAPRRGALRSRDGPPPDLGEALAGARADGFTALVIDTRVLASGQWARLEAAMAAEGVEVPPRLGDGTVAVLLSP